MQRDGCILFPARYLATDRLSMERFFCTSRARIPIVPASLFKSWVCVKQNEAPTRQESIMSENRPTAVAVGASGRGFFEKRNDELCRATTLLQSLFRKLSHSPIVRGHPPIKRPHSPIPVIRAMHFPSIRDGAGDHPFHLGRGGSRAKFQTRQPIKPEENVLACEGETLVD